MRKSALLAVLWDDEEPEEVVRARLLELLFSPGDS
jgi:hypothetical protein